MGAEVPVELAKLDYAAAIFELEQRYIDCPWTLEQIRDEINSENSLFFVALSGDTPIGYVSGVCAADECDVNNIAVEQSQRRRGIGTALIHSLCAAAKKRGAAAMFLSVREDNGPAIGFYESVGFKIVGKRASYYGANSALIMRLDM